MAKEVLRDVIEEMTRFQITEIIICPAKEQAHTQLYTELQRVLFT